MKRKSFKRILALSCRYLVGRRYNEAVLGSSVIPIKIPEVSNQFRRSKTKVCFVYVAVRFRLKLNIFSLCCV